MHDALQADLGEEVEVEDRVGGEGQDEQHQTGSDEEGGADVGASGWLGQCGAQGRQGEVLDGGEQLSVGREGVECGRAGRNESRCHLPLRCCHRRPTWSRGDLALSVVPGHVESSCCCRVDGRVEQAKPSQAKPGTAFQPAHDARRDVTRPILASSRASGASVSHDHRWHSHLPPTHPRLCRWINRFYEYILSDPLGLLASFLVDDATITG